MLSKIKSYIFRRIYTPALAWHIRRKKKIRVLFVLQYLSEWKTEALYIAMLHHPRFEPILGITPCIEIEGEEKRVMDYCEKKEYHYERIDPEKTLEEQVHPDIVVHQKPYTWYIYPQHQVFPNKKSLFIYVPYALHSICTEWLTNSTLTYNSWKFFWENESCCADFKQIDAFSGHNYSVTGLPIMDTLSLPPNKYPDPFTTKDGRKRIIYAPHHTIHANKVLDGIDFSTFLENGEFMLEMAEKYKNQVYFVFKPHPILYKTLYDFWGQEKTDAYYAKWANPGYSHVENGEYIGLFKHSDAMIHDCGSFTLEYMFTGNPVMYLVKDTRRTDNMTHFGKRAYELHYKGNNHEDIEQFIQNVLDGYDPLKEARQQYVASELTPPHGKTACQNIINAILGQEDYI